MLIICRKRAWGNLFMCNKILGIRHHLSFLLRLLLLLLLLFWLLPMIRISSDSKAVFYEFSVFLMSLLVCIQCTG